MFRRKLSKERDGHISRHLLPGQEGYSLPLPPNCFLVSARRLVVVDSPRTYNLQNFWLCFLKNP